MAPLNWLRDYPYHEEVYTLERNHFSLGEFI